MTDLPDFEDIVGEDTESSTESESTTTEDRDEQMHIKGRYGTKTVRRDDGCWVCDRPADAVLITNMVDGEVKPDYDDVILVCDAHEGDVRGDLEYPHELVQRVDF